MLRERRQQRHAIVFWAQRLTRLSAGTNDDCATADDAADDARLVNDIADSAFADAGSRSRRARLRVRLLIAPMSQQPTANTMCALCSSLLLVCCSFVRLLLLLSLFRL